MNAKMIEAMKGIRDNLSIIIEEMENKKTVTTAEDIEAKDVKTPVTTSADEVPKTSRKEREANEKIPNPNDDLTQEQLDGLSYNNLKRLAKEMGIPAVGSRDELTQKILNFDGEVPNTDEEESEETEAESVQEEAPARKSSPRKLGKKTEEPEPDEEDEEEEVDPIVEKVNEAVEDMTNEEIMDILADVGVKAKGKRQSLISAVIKAVRDGKIDLDDEESDEEDEDEAETEAESDTNEEVEYDVNDIENPDMTEERRTAIKAYEAEIRADFENGDLTRKQLVEWLNEFNDTKDTMKKKSDEDILNEYIYCSCLLINDEGEMPEEEGGYTVNGVAYCCGHELAYNEDNDTYICEVCGAEYEAGE